MSDSEDYPDPANMHEVDLKTVALVFDNDKTFEIYRLDHPMNTGGKASMFAGKGETTVGNKTVEHLSCVHCTPGNNFTILVTRMRGSKPTKGFRLDDEDILDTAVKVRVPRITTKEIGVGRLVHAKTKGGHSIDLHFNRWNHQRTGVCLVRATLELAEAAKPAEAKEKKAPPAPPGVVLNPCKCVVCLNGQDDPPSDAAPASRDLLRLGFRRCRECNNHHMDWKTKHVVCCRTYCHLCGVVNRGCKCRECSKCKLKTVLRSSGECFSCDHM